jgi:hypothetical protein
VVFGLVDLEKMAFEMVGLDGGECLWNVVVSEGEPQKGNRCL